MSQARTITHYQEIKILLVKTGIEQQGFCNISSNHPMPHLNQSPMLPKRTMRNKRFADRIAHISTGFCIKPVSSSNWWKNDRYESSREPVSRQENDSRIIAGLSYTLGDSRPGAGLYHLVFVAECQRAFQPPNCDHNRATCCTCIFCRRRWSNRALSGQHLHKNSWITTG